jgi:3-methyladenine DNA glycosylase AlkC
MPEPLKNLYTRALIERLAHQLQGLSREFDRHTFVNDVFREPWHELELKARMRRVTLSLRQHLPDDFPATASLLSECSRQFSGFETMFFAEYVELFGLEHFEESMRALEIMTRYSSAEFAVRPFIVKYPERMMQQMLDWSRSSDPHIRRLASEGCRPRLPWAMALPRFKRDPSPILPILENLRDDQSDYVYRSVANNLNDISRDHPELVLELAQRWYGHSATTDWVIKHACRTLLKDGNSEALALFGFADPGHVRVRNFEMSAQVEIGDRLHFSCDLVADKPLGLCRLEYRILYLRANGSLSGKVFKISEVDIKAHRRRVERSHSFRPITTRVFYPGQHGLELLLNGKTIATGDFRLC